MDPQVQQRIEELVAGVGTFRGGLTAPPWFPIEEGESLYLVYGPVELIELRHTPTPLTGGTARVEVEKTCLLGSTPGHVRSVAVNEEVPSRESGWLAVTDRRVEFLSQDRNRVWPLDLVSAAVHDGLAPESWILSSNHKITAGLRYPGMSALQIRFALAVVIAEVRGTRPQLAADLRSQLPSGKVRASGALGLVRRAYVGSPGRALPGRIAQGVGTSFATLVLLVSVLPDPPRDTTTASSSTSESASASPEPTVEAFVSTEADEEAARQEAAATSAAAEQRRRAAATVAAQRAAAQRAAAQRAAAQKAVMQRAAAKRKSAQKAAAAKAAAEQAAPEQAAQEQAPEPATGCTPEYPDFCIPLRAGDAYNCGDFAENNFTALAPDPYRLDRDSDGVACES